MAPGLVDGGLVAGEEPLVHLALGRIVLNILRNDQPTGSAGLL